MEPGGDDTHASYDAWLALGGDELIDCRAHHQWELETQGIDNPDWTKWHRRDRPNVLQATWRPLILMLLAYKGESCDRESVRVYQRDDWGMSLGETAVIELNALHARSLAAKVEREVYRPKRIVTIRERMVENRPAFAVFYGTQYRTFYEEIVGHAFDEDGFASSGDTTCVLVPHSARSGKTNCWWARRGVEIRRRCESRGRV